MISRMLMNIISVLCWWIPPMETNCVCTPWLYYTKFKFRFTHEIIVFKKIARILDCYQVSIQRPWSLRCDLVAPTAEFSCFSSSCFFTWLHSVHIWLKDSKAGNESSLSSHKLKLLSLNVKSWMLHRDSLIKQADVLWRLPSQEVIPSFYKAMDFMPYMVKLVRQSPSGKVVKQKWHEHSPPQVAKAE